jgi:hypothetical protein
LDAFNLAFFDDGHFENKTVYFFKDSWTIGNSGKVYTETGVWYYKIKDCSVYEVKDGFGQPILDTIYPN